MSAQTLPSLRLVGSNLAIGGDRVIVVACYGAEVRRSRDLITM